MAPDRQPGAGDYERVLTLLDDHLTDSERRALVAHAQARGHDLDVLEIALAAGAVNEHWTYGQYGRLGQKLAEALGNVESLGGIWTRAIGKDHRDPETGVVRWTMHSRLAAAVLEMPWALDSAGGKGWEIAKEDVQRAISDLNSNVEHPFHDSTGYDLIYLGRRYPPKAVLGLAVKHAAKISLVPQDFVGGEGSKCFRILRSLGFLIEPKPGSKEAQAVAEEAERAIEQRLDISPTKRRQLIDARRGQGFFRRNVARIEKCCRVTGVSDPPHLRASHIKPWARSNDFEKLDGNNGLLLAPHVDHLFDRGWISFDDGGQLLVSPALHSEVLARWGIDANMNVGPFREKQRHYIEYHRSYIFESPGSHGAIGVANAALSSERQ